MKLDEIPWVRDSELEITMKLWLTKSLCKSLRYLVWLGEETWSMKDLPAPLFQESLSLNLRCLSNWDSKLEMKLSHDALGTCSLKSLYRLAEIQRLLTWDFPVNMICTFIPLVISTSVIYLDNLWGISIFCWCRHNDLQMEMKLIHPIISEIPSPAVWTSGHLDYLHHLMVWKVPYLLWR